MPYTVQTLTDADLPALSALHDATCAGLCAAEQTFMLRKDAAFFTAHLGKGDGNTLLGIYDGADLVAEGLVRHPTPDDPADGMVDCAAPIAPQDKSLLQGVCVRPDYRGHGLMGLLVAAWQDHAAAHGRRHLLAEIDTRNQASWRSFLHAGLALESLGEDPSDGTLVYNAHQIASETPDLTAAFNTAACPAGDLEAQRRLYAGGHRCIAFDKTQRLMIFAPPGQAPA